eukprot:scaffold2952_cov312-Pinguiococcus_pyrenoidosus.AAC.13
MKSVQVSTHRASGEQHSAERHDAGGASRRAFGRGRRTQPPCRDCCAALRYDSASRNHSGCEAKSEREDALGLWTPGGAKRKRAKRGADLRMVLEAADLSSGRG